MTKKYKYNDIPSFTNRAGYFVTIEWAGIERTIEGYIKDFGLNLDPDFQRAHVWDENKQAKYIEYCLRGGQSGRDLYFNCIGWNSTPGEYVIVDGKQRLEAVRKFMRNELEIFHDGKFLKNKKPIKFEDFDDRPRLIKSCFTWHINDLKDRKAVLQWYLDLNEGGVVHTSEELNKVKKLLAKEK
jgi:uncharacterized protein with ParB-like and HNH nuclease domain